MKAAAKLQKHNRAEALGLKPSQLIVITSISRYCVDLKKEKIVPEEDAAFQYVLTKPVNYYYLLNILTHILKGLKLCSESSASSPIPAILMPSDTQSPQNDIELSVLIADDNDFCRNAVVRLLQKFKVRITAVENGNLALEKFNETNCEYDLGIFDYQMPLMDGMNLIRNIREIEKNRDYPKKMPIICIFVLAFNDKKLCLGMMIRKQMKTQ